MKTCDNCGDKTRDKNTYCPRCGVSLDILGHSRRSMFVIHDDNNSRFDIVGVFDSYQEAFKLLPDHGHAITEYPLNEISEGKEPS